VRIIGTAELHNLSCPSLVVSVVITTKNSSRTIGRTLSSLDQFIRRGYISELIVVDSQSTDDTVTISKEHGARVIHEGKLPPILGSHRLLQNYASFFHSCNLGWKSSTGDLVMFIDSDAFVGGDFFPSMTEFFENQSLGILGCHAKPTAKGTLGRTIGEMWLYHGSFLRTNTSRSPKSSLFAQLYELFVWGRTGMRDLYTSGPCYVARRSSLAFVNGLDMTGDVGVSERIVKAGWRAKWWIDSPVYHQPKRTYRQLIRERLLWGYMTPFFHRGKISALFRTLSAVLLATLGGMLLFRATRNWRHIPVQLIVHSSVFVGSIYGLASHWGLESTGLEEIGRWISS
jgi:glycosyltransferase involved in cell wall biosynthesis